MSKLDDEIEIFDFAIKGMVAAILILPFFVAALVFGFRYMEKGICEGYAGNTYSLWTGRCTWPPLFSVPEASS